MKAAAQVIQKFDETQISHLTEDGAIDIDIEGTSTRLEIADVDILSEELGDWSVAQEGPVTVALDTYVSSELLSQGFSREAVNRIQTMRKSADLNLTDRILIRYFAEGRLREAIETHRDLICHETLAL